MPLETQSELIAPEQDNIIKCENIKKNFWRKTKKHYEMFSVIENISLDVGKNEFLVILGPGQSGKTVLLNLIAGLERPTEGQVIVNGRVVEGPGPDRGVVFQSIALFPWKTVLQNVEMGPRLNGIKFATRRSKAEYYIRLVGLEGFEHKYPSELSGGMKQRVGIARAYCNDPVVMLMDEPFGHLDAQTRYMMEEELVRIWENEKRPVVFVTNNLEEAIYLADRIVILDKCPTSIKEQYKVELNRPREYTGAGFLELRRKISDIMEVE